MKWRKGTKGSLVDRAGYWCFKICKGSSNPKEYILDVSLQGILLCGLAEFHESIKSAKAGAENMLKQFRYKSINEEKSK